jgi:hypothetical protein
MSDPSGVRPHATRVQLSLPEVPRQELFLVAPVLGRVAGSDLAILGDGRDGAVDRIVRENGFQPLLVQEVDAEADLVALTEACWVGSARKFRRVMEQGGSIRRALVDAGGAAVGELPEVPLALGEDEAARCQNLVDLLPRAALRPGGYVFEARLAGKDDAPPQRVHFTVEPPE